ncbi:MAG: hypothetical protein FWH00_02690 [Oscillospiraceae bacterium]|nr:hypothetical protein [Oscillospiraceae bacterium]
MKLRFEWDGEKISLAARYLFLRYTILPQKPRKPQKLKKKKQKPKKEKPPKQKFTPGSLEDILMIMREAGGVWNRLRRHIVLYRVKLYMVICGEDAHDTAIKYGQYSTGVFGLAALAGELCTLKAPTIFLYPDFTGQKNRYDISFRLRVRPIFAIYAGIYLLTRLPKIKSKGGRKHEQITVSK